MLVSLDYEVITCTDGDEAWNALSQEDAPELAILDWVMPGVSGIEICKRARASEGPNSLYIILLTGRGQRSDVIEGFQAGADDYLTKPFNVDELHARVRVGHRIVDMQRQRVEQETAYYVRQLEETVAELQASRARVVAAQEDVRRAIAEELHGHVQTRMFMLYLNLQDLRDKIAVSPTEAQIALEQAAEELDRIREEDIRNISHRLHPSVIKVSLAAGLRSLQDQFERSIRVELEIADEVAGMEPGEGSKIPLNVRLGFYRVAEEAMGNVIKHARATQISVKLCVPEGGGLRLAIEDNGRGFAPSESKGRSIGLATIRDHMAAIGGDFEIESAPGQGTKITATAPLKVAQAVARG